MTRIAALLSAGFILAATPAWGQEADAAPDGETAAEATAPESWDVAAPPLDTREISINVDQGTWMSLDVSPDGSMIAFDLLGDIYVMPIGGGEARSISSGLAWDYQPRFSPDGSQIAFTSDREGGDNIWVMDADGENARAITNESFRLLNNPTWSPDGRYIAARKHFTTSRSAGTGEIWLYHVLGGNGVALVERPSESYQKEQGEPVFSADGRYIYFTRSVSSGNSFVYAEDSNGDLFNIRRYELETGEVETVVSGAGGAVRPAPSPDGESIAFVRRERIDGALQSTLYVKDLRSGEERRIYADLDPDMQETWGVTGMYPNMDWTPDGETIVFWAGGHIRRIDVESGESAVIPFSVNDTREIIDPPRPQIDVAPDSFDTTMARFAAVSPDGERIVFESLGQLWIQDNRDGAEPRRLTRNDGDRRELFPAWSRDGRSIAFVTWDDEELGSIRTIGANGRNERTITEEPGHYRRPQFSPDGSMIVFEKGSGGFLTAPEWSETTGLFRISSSGGEMTMIAENGDIPHFGSDNDRVFYESGNNLMSVDLDGENERTHLTSDMVREYHVSPDGEHVAFVENYDTYVTVLLPAAESVSVGRSTGAMPVVEVSGNGSSYPNWSGGGATLNWSLGPTVFSADLADFRPDPGGEGSFEPPTEGVSISMSVDADRPTGLVALTGARIITMAGEDGGVIENGVIVIDGNRIAAVGSADEVEIPSGAQTVDVSGRTILPGLIDGHAHGPQGTDEIIPEQNWNAIAHLALGVTTIHDPSNQASHIFAASEYQRAGRYLAPRIYSTGEVVYGARAPGFYASIESAEDAREHVFRLASQGAHSIKNYNQPRRDQRQQVVAASMEAGLAVVAEGGANFHMDMALLADGNTMIEHNLPQLRIYDDVVSMFAQSHVGINPTHTVTYGGLAGDPYWRQATNVWEHPILSRHAPPRLLQASSVRRTTAPEADFVDDDAAAVSLQLAEAGVLVPIGAHGQQQGLASHWEIWTLVRGGMTELQALQAATTVPAEAYGFDRDIGSLQEGMLADLVVLEGNPLDDIRNTETVDMVMLNGRLYDADTMNETVTGDTERQPYFWE